ncbi:hypothetical protein SK128_000890 [Halocaridina rubra]|uniref:CUB domain-containing protein n=1 Tax=Halocaridina rubra TaxID=373956 RepID=A0AAN8WTN7_HALRR
MDIRFRTDESTRKGGFSITGKRVKCDEGRPLEVPRSHTRPSRGEDSLEGSNTASPLTPQSSGTNDSSLPRLNPIPVVPLNQSEIDITYILNAIGRGPLPNLNRDVPTERTENVSISNSDVEEEFTEVDPGLITEETSTNADQNIPGNPDFNPFTGTGLQPTLPTIPGGTPTGFPTPSGFPTTSGFPATSSFPTFPPTFNAVGGCDGVFTEQTFTISSPNYPNQYPANSLQVNVIELDLPPGGAGTGQCTGDYLDIAGTRLCGNIQNRVLTFDFPSQTIDMTFQSDATTSGRGFTMTVQQLANCGNPIGPTDNVTQEISFVYTSPFYPNQYPPNTDQTLTVLKASPSIRRMRPRLPGSGWTETLWTSLGTNK